MTSDTDECLPLRLSLYAFRDDLQTHGMPKFHKSAHHLIGAITLTEPPDKRLIDFDYVDLEVTHVLGVVAKPCLPRIHIANPCG